MIETRHYDIRTCTASPINSLAPFALSLVRVSSQYYSILHTIRVVTNSCSSSDHYLGQHYSRGRRHRQEGDQMNKLKSWGWRPFLVSSSSSVVYIRFHSKTLRVDGAIKWLCFPPKHTVASRSPMEPSFWLPHIVCTGMVLVTHIYFTSWHPPTSTNGL